MNKPIEEKPRPPLEEEDLEIGDPRQCPMCGKPSIITCRCFRADSICKNGHTWHICVKHHKIVLGHSNHSRPVTKCTCLDLNGVSTYLRENDNKQLAEEYADLVRDLYENINYIKTHI